MVNKDVLIEVCVDSAAGLDAAIVGGAGRIELCSSLDLGGLTPSAGFMVHAARIAPLPVYPLIRPRQGGFCYNSSEVAIMVSDILKAREAGLSGVVIGASQPDGALDVEVLQQLIGAAGSLDLTLHRAFDLAPDKAKALEIAVSLGFSRVLTSGGAVSAIDGLACLRALCEQASGRIGILPGSGVNADNAQGFLAIEGIEALHASCSSQLDEAQSQLMDFGFVSHRTRQTDEGKVRALCKACQVFSA